MYARHASVKNKYDNSGYFFRLISLIVCIGAAVSFALVILSLVDMGISLTARTILLILLVDAALIILPMYLILSGKSGYNLLLRIGSIAIAVMMFCVNLFVSTAIADTSDIIEVINSGTTGVVEYSIVAQRNSGIELSTKTKVRAGIQSTDSCKEEAADALKKLTAASLTEYDNLSEMIVATESEDLDIAVVQSVMLGAYAEYFPDSYDKLDVLTTFMAGTEKALRASSNAKIDVTKPFVIYVGGADVFGDIDQVARSDVNMLVLVDPEHYKILLVNTPRDYYVQLHGTSGYKDKLTHAGVYGIEMSENTVEDLYNINIDYHVRINFDTVVNLVDAMGGIVVDNPTEFMLWGVTYAAGEIYLNGDSALLYARARKGLAHGDEDRGENQQRVIEAIVDRITKPHVVIHYKSIFGALSGTFRSNIPPKVIAQLFSRQMAMGGSWTIEKMSATGKAAYKPTYSMGAQELSVLIPDEDSLAEVRAAIRDFMRGTD